MGTHKQGSLGKTDNNRVIKGTKLETRMKAGEKSQIKTKQLFNESTREGTKAEVK